jgi:ABC-2 type transport system ATP-binding protein
VSGCAIETDGLWKRFGSTLAVADLSLRVRSGEVFGFLGPNGAGKTTSVKMLLALVPPGGGSARVLDAPIGDRATRARIGFLPEHFRFHDCLTARELLRFHGRLHGLRGRGLDRRIDMLLARVDLLDASDRPLQGYSKGMLQRTGLAQALINDPDLVFLDEPTSGLDPLGRLLVRDIITELRARGTTVFLNSHLLGEVEATCDRVAFLKEGHVAHEMSLTDASSALDVDVRVSPIDSCLLEGLSRRATHVRRLDEDRVSMRVTGDAAIPAVVCWLVERGAQVYRVQARRKSLDEWFVDVMGEDQRPG